MLVRFRLLEDLSFTHSLSPARLSSALWNSRDEIQVDIITQYFSARNRAASWHAAPNYTEALVNEGRACEEALGGAHSIHLYDGQSSRTSIILHEVPPLPVAGSHGRGAMVYGREKYIKGEAILWAVISIQ